MKRNITVISLALFLAALVVGCTTTEKGAIAGGALGAGTGAVIGHQSGRGIEGAVIGGAVGAISGGLIGHELDKSKQQTSPPAATSSPSRESTSGVYSGGGDYYEGEYNAEGRKWVPEREETRVYTSPDGTTYEKTVIVPGHYE
ncbi:MAG: hypothetical protein C4532_03450 [Candidatus Abyssobacteria bacterium SURF_17]|jgi:uncharacterized protein YcfJ|uniref:Glycine zipper domain-containing protein n=1 Tax=Candidatus Abyssobacteria bacterium SURF_17 TaxID=2093361 RepID=A0A419F600_9BACT|nr:MAG: hypothetical protein C4532_03450 [Candidatus Abyssubacteria bacterium SURF_17]